MNIFVIILFLAGAVAFVAALIFGILSGYWSRRLHDRVIYHRSLSIMIFYLPWMAFGIWFLTELDLPADYDFPIIGGWSLMAILPYFWVCLQGSKKKIPELSYCGKFGILAIVALTSSILFFCYGAIV